MHSHLYSIFSHVATSTCALLFAHYAQVVARDFVMRANLGHVPLLGVLASEQELNEEFPLEHASEELSAETISARILRYIHNKTSSIPRPAGRAALQASVQEVDPHVALVRCMQHLVWLFVSVSVFLS